MTSATVNSCVEGQDPCDGFKLFSAGQFAGRRIRIELFELQHAELGRKYGKVDRRPLDPPPTVLLRMYELADDSQVEHGENELDYGNMAHMGLICSVDIFPVPENMYHATSEIRRESFEEPSFANSHVDTSSSRKCRESEPLLQQRARPIFRYLNDRSAQPAPTIIHQIGNHLITESSKMTSELVGERVTEPTMIDYQGQKVLVFVFGDIAMRREGVFILRYRMFDIYAVTAGTMCTPVLAQIYGKPFKVYSTRDFPGLDQSTDLTMIWSSSNNAPVLAPLKEEEFSRLKQSVVSRLGRERERESTMFADLLEIPLPRRLFL